LATTLEPAGRRQLLRFLFKRLPGLFDFAVPFDLRVLFDELRRFFLEFKIGFLGSADGSAVRWSVTIV
jgi:hypothetical protein